MRLLLAGWVNSPHVTGWAEMAMELGYEVALAGHRAPAWPEPDIPPGLIAYEEYRLGRLPLARSLELGRRLRATTERVKPDLIHAHWLAEYGWLAARHRLHPLISSAWGSDVLGAGRLGRRRARVALRGADLVLADSEALARAARMLAPDGPPVERFHPGVDLDRFRPGDRDAARAALGLAPGVPTIVAPRGLAPVYNPLRIVGAFARLRAELPTARLVFKQPSEGLPAALSAAIDAAGLSRHVATLGHVSPSAMPLVYQAADVVVSIPASDSSPATAWEALACGRPLVVSDLAWARAELAHGENAWLVPVDEEALAGALLAVLTDPALAERLGREGQALVGQRMDRRERMRALDAQYRALLAEPRGLG